MLVGNIWNVGHSLALAEGRNNVLRMENIEFFFSELQRKTNGNSPEGSRWPNPLQLQLSARRTRLAPSGWV